MDMERYNRQVLIDGIGEEGQEKLSRSRVTVVGAGGLGSPVSIYLTAAGIGNLTIFDYKEVDLPDLNRQVIHWEKDIGRMKGDSARDKLMAFNSEIEIQVHTYEITPENAVESLKASDVVVDCLDNFETRYTLNDTCIKLGIPLVHAAVEGMRGQAATVIPGESPCLRCIIPKAPPKKPIFPIIGFTAGFFGMVEASEVIKLITGVGTTLAGKLMVANLRDHSYDVMGTKRRDDCPSCGK